jgi:hypothetical protein
MLEIRSFALRGCHPPHDLDGDRDVAVARRDTGRLEGDAAADVHRVQLHEEALSDLSERDPTDPGQFAELELEIVEVHSGIASLAA